MDLLRPLTLSTAGPSSSAPLLPVIKTTISFSKARRRFSHHLPRLSATAASSSPALWHLSPPPESLLETPNRWMVIMEKPRVAGSSKSEIIDFYVETLARVVGSEKEAQMCIYDASYESNFGFCCDIDEESSRQLTRIPGVLSVRPDNSLENGKKDYSRLSLFLAEHSKYDSCAPKFSPTGKNNEYWLVQLKRHGVETVTKAQMVDYYSQILTKVLRNEEDAQVSIYHISWEKDFGFCCHIDEECAKDLSNVPGVLSVKPDLNFGSQIKDYKGNDPLLKSSNSSEANQVDVKTKRLFVTGLSFYTSEKTLRAAFEGFGELVEVKVIMDKISKRSKGYAFLEYTTEEAAGAALKEMNGKIINGWMIVVDVARTNASRSPRGKPRDQTQQLP